MTALLDLYRTRLGTFAVMTSLCITWCVMALLYDGPRQLKPFEWDYQGDFDTELTELLTESEGA